MKELELINQEGNIYIEHKQFNKDIKKYYLCKNEDLFINIELFNKNLDYLIDCVQYKQDFYSIINNLNVINSNFELIKKDLIKINILDENRNLMTCSSILNNDYFGTIIYNFDFEEYEKNKQIIMNVYLLKH